MNYIFLFLPDAYPEKRQGHPKDLLIWRYQQRQQVYDVHEDCTIQEALALLIAGQEDHQETDIWGYCLLVNVETKKEENAATEKDQPLELDAFASKVSQKQRYTCCEDYDSSQDRWYARKSTQTMELTYIFDANYSCSEL